MPNIAQYDKAAEAAARAVMASFSTSFGMATKLFPVAIRQDIYNVYGLVRLADEVVDSYRGEDAAQQLDNLELEVYKALKQGFSSNLIVHAFQLSANRFAIDSSLIKPFFASMRMDLHPETYEPKDYETYIYGSAEVVGLMCLKVFCEGDGASYEHLAPGARALGSAFQKVNFLRDLAADHDELQRYYFPIGSFASFDDKTKQQIIADIEADFTVAVAAIEQLPGAMQSAVQAAYLYYSELLNKLSVASAESLKSKRVRIPNSRKLQLLVATGLRAKLKRRQK